MTDSNSFPAPPQPPVWASHVATRRPAFKMHAKIGYAKNAVVNSGTVGGTVFHFENGDWVPVWNYLQDLSCVVCGEDVQANFTHRRIADMRVPSEDRRFVHYVPWQRGLPYDEQHGPCWQTLERERKRQREEKMAKARAAQEERFED